MRGRSAVVNPWRRPRKFWVYDVVHDGEVVYVGSSGNPNRRIRQHMRTGVARGPEDLRVVSEHDKPDDALATEYARIRKLKPRLNRRSAIYLPKKARAVDLPVDSPPLRTHETYRRPLEAIRCNAYPNG